MPRPAGDKAAGLLAYQSSFYEPPGYTRPSEPVRIRAQTLSHRGFCVNAPTPNIVETRRFLFIGTEILTWLKSGRKNGTTR